MIKKLDNICTYEYASMSWRNLFISMLAEFAKNFVEFTFFILLALAVKLFLIP